MILRSLFAVAVCGLPLFAQDSSIQPTARQAAIRAETVNRATPLRQDVPATPAKPSTEPRTTQSDPLQSAAPAGNGPAVEQPKPSWETQQLARTYAFTIPAPRGLITDRHGEPLAQTRIGYNLAIQFPTPPKFSDTEAARYIAEQVALAKQILRREVTLEPDNALKHYKNRGIMPLVLQSVQDLTPKEVEAIKQARPPGLVLQPVYLRYYPKGTMAAHIIGYVGRQGGYALGGVENHEMLWPEFEGREGLEKSFNQQLTGKPGVMHVTYDAQGRKAKEQISQPPIPGQNVVTTLDVKIQAAAEQSIATTKRPGAIVVTDPYTGEILALASLPNYDLNHFIPRISQDEFDALSKDPTSPLVGRAFYSAYPAGSTWKVITGLAAMNEGFVEPTDTFEGSPSMEIAGRTFHNHTRRHQGMLAFPQALTVSSNTYFYRMGLKTGHRAIIDYAARLGFGRRTGIPLGAESAGNLPDDEYMLRVHKRRFMPGDIANLSIGQGDLLVTPLQMAHAMGAISNGGTVYQPRLVLQVQGADDKIALGYEMRVRDQLDLDPTVMNALRAGMVGVVQGRGGTATNASIPGIMIAAKTGTAQWGAGKNEKVAAWFAGFAPADRPKYAFAAVYEGKEARNDVHGGSHAAPMISRVLKEILKPQPKDKKGGLRKKRNIVVDEDDEDEMDAENAPRPRVVRPATDSEDEDF